MIKNKKKSLPWKKNIFLREGDFFASEKMEGWILTNHSQRTLESVRNRLLFLHTKHIINIGITGTDIATYEVSSYLGKHPRK